MIATAAPTPTLFSTATTSHLVAMPATVAAGDALLMGFSCISLNVTTPSNWLLLNTSVNGYELNLFYKIAVGSEGGTTVDVVTSSAARAVAQVYRVTGWHGTTPPEVGTAATGTSVNPNPPNLAPSWGPAENLWIAIANAGGTNTASAYPTGYVSGADDAATGTQASTIVSAHRVLTATAENPGPFTISASQQWNAQTVAFRPAVAVPDSSGARIGGDKAIRRHPTIR